MINEKQYDAIVIGSGLAGLTAATLIARSGRSVIVLEQSSQLGGRAITTVKDGIHFNLGAHALYCGGHTYRILRELNVHFTGSPPNSGRRLVFTQDRFHPLPANFQSLVTSKLFSLSERWRALRFFAQLPKLDLHSLRSVPYSDWIDQHAGRGQFAMLLRGLCRLTTYSDAPEQISAEAALEQLRISNAGVWYIDGGWQTLVDGLRIKLHEFGGEIRTGAAAIALQSTTSGTAIQLGCGEILHSKFAAIAASPKVACKLLQLPIDAPMSILADESLQSKAACLDVALDTLPKPENRFAIGLDQPLYFSVHSPSANLAPNGVKVLHLMKYLRGNDDTPGKVLESELESFLDRLQPGWRSFVRARRFLPRMTTANGIPLASQNGISGRPKVSVREFPNVFLAGDWVGQRSLIADASAASAEEAARQIIAAYPHISGHTHAVA